MKTGHMILFIVAILMISACSQVAEQQQSQTGPQTQQQVLQATCDDGIKNQGEEGIDCGGPCKPCPGCTDGIKNQGEEGIDCGGPCGACASCNDSIKNQGEEKVDCGGPCKPCPIEKYELSTADQEALKSKLKLNTQAQFLRPSYVQGLAPGQSYVFALGITNTLFENSTFYVNLKFLDARDLSNNHIQGADETTIMRWFDKNTFGSYRLGKYEQAFIPVGVTVGDEIGPGKETVPGTYYFRAYIKYQKTSYTVDDFANVEFSFRVV